MARLEVNAGRTGAINLTGDLRYAEIEIQLVLRARSRCRRQQGRLHVEDAAHSGPCGDCEKIS